MSQSLKEIEFPLHYDEDESTIRDKNDKFLFEFRAHSPTIHPKTMDRILIAMVEAINNVFLKREQKASAVQKINTNEYPNLNKEEFWDNVEKIFPDQVPVFYEWIDDYKLRNKWHELFNCDIAGKKYAPKYHDLPLATQWGIFQQFMAESCRTNMVPMPSVFVSSKDMENISVIIMHYFKELKANDDFNAAHLNHDRHQQLEEQE